MQIINAKDVLLYDEDRQAYIVFGKLPDGRICGIYKFLYTYALIVGINDFGYDDRYCYHTLPKALVAFTEWNDKGEPEGWHRHPASGRRRDETGREWVQP